MKQVIMKWPIYVSWPKEEDEVSSNLSNLSISKFTLQELYDAFNELVEDFEKVILKKGTKQVGIHGGI